MRQNRKPEPATQRQLKLAAKNPKERREKNQTPCNWMYFPFDPRLETHNLCQDSLPVSHRVDCPSRRCKHLAQQSQSSQRRRRVFVLRTCIVRSPSFPSVAPNGRHDVSTDGAIVFLDGSSSVVFFVWTRSSLRLRIACVCMCVHVRFGRRRPRKRFADIQQNERESI